MTDVASQFDIPNIPETKGALKLTGSYVRALSDLLPRCRIDASNYAAEGKIPQVGETIEGVVVFIDMGSYTSRTARLAPRETAFLVNKFFMQLGPACEKARATFDKTIRDCVMLLLSEALGSPSPQESAIRLALSIVDFDPWSFDPHLGVAEGAFWLGLNGPPQAMSLSAYGTPVNLAARLLHKSPLNSILLPRDYWERVESSITLPDSFSVDHKLSPEGNISSDDTIKDFPGLRYTILRRKTKWGPAMEIPGSVLIEE
jgi:class 3 adenylate cyclase